MAIAECGADGRRELGNLNGGPFPTPAQAILAQAQEGRFLIEDFVPLADSLEFGLGQQYWRERGSKAFISDARPVPYAINNDGSLSRRAAEVFFASLIEAEKNGPLEPTLYVLELGIGVGLFARFFLDAFKEICARAGKDFYRRLVYIAGDRSERMLADACRRGIFANHPGRYLIRVVDALEPGKYLLDDVSLPGGCARPLRAVFLNYVLDCLPAGHLKINAPHPQPLSPTGRGEQDTPHPQPLFPTGRGEQDTPHPQPLSPTGRGEQDTPHRQPLFPTGRGEPDNPLTRGSSPMDPAQGGGEQGGGQTSEASETSEVLRLCVRTCLARHVPLEEYTELTASDLARRAKSGTTADRKALMDAYGLFASEYDYRPIPPDEQLPHLDFAVTFARKHGLAHLLHNYGAIQSVEALLGLLHNDGFILINDYGQADLTPQGDFEHQRFSQSTSVGLNFPLLKAYFGDAGRCTWVEPEGENGSIYSRMLCRKSEIRSSKSETNPKHEIKNADNHSPVNGATSSPTPVPLTPGPSSPEGRGETGAVFAERFGKAAWEWRQERWNLARLNIQYGRIEAALSAYHQTLERQPGNWILLHEIALFLTFTLRNAAAGIAMAKAAVELNPACSPDLWNTLGDAYYELGKLAEAKSAYQRALRVNPSDVRGRYNLAWVLVAERRYPAALTIIAEALGLDQTGEYYERLVRKQTEVLQRLAQRNQHKEFLLANRVSTKPGPASPPRPSVPDAKGIERNGHA